MTAFVARAPRHKIVLNESLVEFGPPEPHFAGEALARLLAKRPPPTAIVLTTVMATLGVAEKLMALKINVPDDVSVVGFGARRNRPPCYQASPPAAFFDKRPLIPCAGSLQRRQVDSGVGAALELVSAIGAIAATTALLAVLVDRI
jgi:Periplasmic binding protein-like domain